ncbi:hypothetical protein [Streptomyces flavalbus]|uniref:Uncharacterized protein n=1 Tax=Streptomyces flavalbus TaxID=2665155 RepID=A0ABW2WCS1_9ACTN
MRPALARIAVAAVAVPALTFLGTPTARADAVPSPSAHDLHDLHDVDGWRSLHDAHTDGAHTHTHDAPEVERPRAAVLTVFGTVNAGVLGSAAVVRRRSRARRKGAPR